MIVALTCPQCTAPVKTGTITCAYCGVGLVVHGEAQNPNNYQTATPIGYCSTSEAWPSSECKVGVTTFVTTGYDPSKRRT